MTDEPRNAAKKTRGRPFEPGNPGKPKGARRRTTQLAETLMSDDAEAIVKKVVEAAKAGDLTAARLVLDRIAPPRRDSPVRFNLPRIERPSEAAAAMTALLEAVADGEITPSEADGVARLVEGFVKTLETSELETRIAALERANEGKHR
ncbi:DUF5681 domain-containing protein [Methylocystis bryophila]|uniref:DUF5681 domain-containing protein n=1 Tax=Methylocystis bryophila TaxID=655015 RepID=A0A1W6MSZ7_9HYPH|nr:DUF5681 domain-containing protein [Methylocystis bryophila]ARN80682.1 hypothetical protein B1812_05895 [Methylocystis bryophila]BDV40748.1 hypothetical protein DSM21852_40010 [Methylocystis bryophila]